MVTLVILIFIVGYIAIALEHVLKVNKAASALITGILCWTIYFLKSSSTASASDELLHHLGDISSILFFLLGAMTIVELIDSNNGFRLITRNIGTKKKATLLIVVTVVTFFLSAILDNLTTTIVMVSLCSKLLPEREDRFWFAGMIIIAANAGGAWSPLGDVTTTMLWIGGQITALNIMKHLFLPSLAVCIVPALLIGLRYRGKRLEPAAPAPTSRIERREDRITLFLGIGLLLFVPVFKTLTHLPPFMGILLALAVMWVVTTVMHKDKNPDVAESYMVTNALQKVDTPSILFFLGILLAVSALQSMGVLQGLAELLSEHLHNNYKIGAALGLLSALVDNVPLVAAAQGMYPLTVYPTDHYFWEFLALTTGTGGSAVIIGSAAGVAAMGLEEIDFMWYLRKISLIALLGFASGILVYLLQTQF